MTEEQTSEESGDLARAFQRLIEDDDFVSQVVADHEAALADYDLTDEETAALRSDADALEGEVAGFAFRLSFAQVMSIGGLRSPALLTASFGLPRLSGGPGGAFTATF